MFAAWTIVDMGLLLCSRKPSELDFQPHRRAWCAVPACHRWVVAAAAAAAAAAGGCGWWRRWRRLWWWVAAAAAAVNSDGTVAAKAQRRRRRRRVRSVREVIRPI